MNRCERLYYNFEGKTVCVICKFISALNMERSIKVCFYYEIKTLQILSVPSIFCPTERGSSSCMYYFSCLFHNIICFFFNLFTVENVLVFTNERSNEEVLNVSIKALCCINDITRQCDKIV